jgi:hypothetical protein
MEVTRTGMKCSQLPTGESRKGGSPQKNRAELEGYAGAHDSVRIAENNITSATKQLRRKMKNRRVPNGTHGGVGGRLLK